MTRKLSKRDMILLCMVALIAVGAAYYYLLYKPITEHVGMQEARFEELQFEVTMARAYTSSLDRAFDTIDELNAGIEEITASYYPVIQPQYFVNMMRAFADDLGLGIAALEVGQHESMAIDKLIPDEREITDSLTLAKLGLSNALREQAGSEPGEGVRRDKPSVKPGDIMISRMTFYLYDGELETYLEYLEKINNAGRPIYIEEFMIAPKRNTELEQKTIEAFGLTAEDEDELNEILSSIEAYVIEFELKITIVVMHLPFSTDESGEFELEVVPPANSMDSFTRGTYLKETTSGIGWKVEK